MRALIIDTETTGLSHNHNQVLTVGMLLSDFYPDGVDHIASKHLLIRHERYNVSGLAMQINKIDLTEHHKKAIDGLSAINEMNLFIRKHRINDLPLVGHNIGFDIRFLRELYRQNKKDFFDLETIDTRDLWIDLRSKGIVPSNLKGSLKVVSKHFDIDYSSAHDALEDCKITAQVLHKILKLKGMNENCRIY